MPGFFYNLGKTLGQGVRKANWVFRSLAGSDADAVRAEHAVGRDLAQAFVREATLDPDPAVGQWLDELGGRLAGCVTDRQRAFRFQAVLAPEVNAFALPGGFVFVTRPLLQLTGGDAGETAFVLGHEMGHVI